MTLFAQMEYDKETLTNFFLFFPGWSTFFRENGRHCYFVPNASSELSRLLGGPQMASVLCPVSFSFLSIWIWHCNDLGRLWTLPGYPAGFAYDPTIKESWQSVLLCFFCESFFQYVFKYLVVIHFINYSKIFFSNLYLKNCIIVKNKLINLETWPL